MYVCYCGMSFIVAGMSVDFFSVTKLCEADSDCGSTDTAACDGVNFVCTACDTGYSGDDCQTGIIDKTLVLFRFMLQSVVALV